MTDQQQQQQQHPITPLPELIGKWIEEADNRPGPFSGYLATQAARWGADQQLDQDAKWLDTNALFSHNLTITPSGGALRQVMRPKPPSLKEQALEALDQADKGLNEFEWQQRSDTIRRAIGSLPD